MKLSSWQEIGSDGDVLLTPYVPKGITGYDDDDDDDDDVIPQGVIFRHHSFRILSPCPQHSQNDSF